MRILLACLALTLAVVPAAMTAGRPVDGRIVARPIPLSTRDPALRRVGRLAWTGGWVLTSGDTRFGGLSSLVTLGDGRLLSVADTGQAVLIDTRGRLPAGRLLGEIRAPSGTGIVKASRDAESLARDPATGTLWIGFEARNSIGRFAPALGVAAAGIGPAEMRDWPNNGGPETLIRLSDGRFIVVAEQAKAPGGARQALLFAGDPTARGTPPPVAFGYRPPDGYDPSDGTALPDGRVLMLNRRLSLLDGFTAKITLFDPAAIRPGATVAGTDVAMLAAPLTVDNMEGIAAERIGGRTIVWLVSDDNFLPVERTLLMRFVLLDPAR